MRRECVPTPDLVTRQTALAGVGSITEAEDAAFKYIAPFEVCEHRAPLHSSTKKM